MKTRAILFARRLRRSIEAVESALAAGDLEAARAATDHHHRLLNLGAVMAGELFGEDATAFSGGGEKGMPTEPPDEDANVFRLTEAA